MFSFFEKKKEKERQLDLKFERLTEEINKIDEWSDPKKIERYILDSCEQIVATTKEIEAEKKEYRRLTGYLNDIKKIEELSEVEIRELKEAAKQIEKLDKAREKYQTESRLLDERHYRVISANASEVPQTITRMTENEAYQDKIKKSMQRLEAEKTRLTMEKEAQDKHRNLLRLLSLSLVVVACILFVIFVWFLSKEEKEASWIFLFLTLAMASGATFVFVYMSRYNRANKRTRRLINETVNLLNSVRLRYANITRAVDYVKKKYNVRSSGELSLYWDRYMAELRRQDQYTKDNSDLEYYTKKFYGILQEMELYHSDMWTSQTPALIDPTELSKLKYSLVEQRKQNRERIAESTKAVKSERDEINRLMYEHNYYVPEILEVISAVDKICGLSESNYPKPTPPPAP